MRRDVTRWVNVLLRKLGTEWTRVTGGHGGRPASATLSEEPTSSHKRRVRALLDAWNRHISDRYLDRDDVKRFDQRTAPPLEQAITRAYESIRRNSPQGAVRFIKNELSRSPRLRDRVRLAEPDEDGECPNYVDYNFVFTQLLEWEDSHCYGLVRDIEQAELDPRWGPPPVFLAAKKWIIYQIENVNGVYRRWGLRFDAKGRLRSA